MAYYTYTTGHFIAHDQSKTLAVCGLPLFYGLAINASCCSQLCDCKHTMHLKVCLPIRDRRQRDTRLQFHSCLSSCDNVIDLQIFHFVFFSFSTTKSRDRFLLAGILRQRVKNRTGKYFLIAWFLPRCRSRFSRNR